VILYNKKVIHLHLFIFLFIQPLRLSAFAEFSYDYELIGALSRIKMYDYAFAQIELLKKRYPNQKELLQLEKARIYLKSGKSKTAQKIIKKISSKSEYYLRSQLLAGEIAYGKKDFKIAEKYYKKYFDKFNRPASNFRKDVEDFKIAVLIYAKVLEKQGKGGEAVRIKGMLRNLKNRDQVNFRVIALQEITSMLAAIENSIATNKRYKAPKGKIKQDIKKLDDLIWSLDSIGLEAILQRIKARLFLGNRKEALIELEASFTGFKNYEQGIHPSLRYKDSPMSGFWYYYGKIHEEMAKKEKKKKKYLKLYITAVKSYYKSARDYPAGQYKTEALLGFDRVRTIIEKKCDYTVEAGLANVEAFVRLKMEQADSLLSQDNYKKALKLYLEAVRIARSSPFVTIAAPRLIHCLGKEKRYFEAEALVSYIQETFPNNKNSADCLMHYGITLFQVGRKNSKSDLLQKGITILNQFTQTYPEHEKAPSLAFMIAEYQYGLAAKLTKKAKKTTNQTTRVNLQHQANKAYQKALPAYNILTTTFKNTPEGVRSLYKKGWIFYLTHNDEQAIKNFLQYAQTETQDKYALDRLQAKFSAAEKLMHTNPSQAIKHFQELQQWLKPNNTQGFKIKELNTAKIAENTNSYLAWAYDKQAQTFIQNLNQSKTTIKEKQQQIKQAQITIDTLNKQIQTLQKDITTSVTNCREDTQLIVQYSKLDQLQIAQMDGETIQLQAEQKIATQQKEKINAQQKQTKIKLINIQQQCEQQNEQLNKIKFQYEYNQKQINKQQTKLLATKQKLDSLNKKIATQKLNLDKARQASKTTIAKLTQAQINGGDDTLIKKMKKTRTKLNTKVAQLLAEKKSQADQIYTLNKQYNTLLTKWQQLQKTPMFTKQTKLANNIKQLQTQLDKNQKILEQTKQQYSQTQQQYQQISQKINLNNNMLTMIKLTKQLTQQKDPKKQTPQQQLAKKIKQQLQQQQLLDQQLYQKFIANKQQQTTALNATIKLQTQQIAQLQTQQQPLQKQFTHWKELALKQFSTFLKKYPKSTHAAENLARIGTIHLEFKRYKKADACFKRLQKEYANKASVLKSAMFSFGRTQYENGQKQSATKTFASILQNPKNIKTNNLLYIADKMLAENKNNLVITCCNTLKKRLKSLDMTQQTTRHLKEKVLFLNGKALYQQKDYQLAIELLETLISFNENTAFFFKTKFLLADSRIKMANPDLSTAEQDLFDIVKYSRNSIEKNKATCLLGILYAKTNDKAKLKKALARFKQIIMLADPKIAENQYWLEEAIYQAANCYSRLGENQQAVEMVQTYQKNYPKGRYRIKITNLEPAL